MALSVNTNVGAAAALQSLNATNRQLETVQSRINTGLNVSSAKDDSAAYAIAQNLRGDLGGLKAVTASLSNAKSVTDVAVAGAEQISDVVNSMRELAKKASDTGISDDTRDSYNQQFESLRDQITTIVNSSSFNDTNLLKTSGGAVSALQSLSSGDTLTVANQGLDLPANETTGKLGKDSTIDTAAKASAMDATLKTLGTTVTTTLSNLGAASNQIDSQMVFTSKLSDTIESGIGNLVDADLAKESAKLQALQVKQQLGVQALSIANQAPQTIISLFK